MSDVSQLLSAIQQGDPSAADQLLPLVYDELRRLAAQRLAREKAGQTLEATALVHEAYLRLVPSSENAQPCWQGRGHFFAAAAEAMRRILVENARRKRSLKRGGDWQRRGLEPELVAAREVSEDLVAVDEALEKLAASDAAVAQLVKLRYFGGLSIKDAAETLGISPRTADSWWAYARSWLLAELQAEGGRRA